MTANRVAFLSHFIICLSVCAGLYFAFVRGVPQMIWASDASMMTSVIAALFVGSSVYMGWLAWQLTPSSALDIEKRAEFGWFAMELSVRIAIVGTAWGLIAQAKTLMSGAAGLGPLATSLTSTITGIGCSAILSVMTYALTSACHRASKE